MSRKKSKKVVLLYIACLFFLVVSLNRSVQAKTHEDAVTPMAKKVEAPAMGVFKSMLTFAQSLFAPQSLVIAQDIPEETSDASGYVGAETCQTCHQDKYDRPKCNQRLC